MQVVAVLHPLHLLVCVVARWPGRLPNHFILLIVGEPFGFAQISAGWPCFFGFTCAF
jgi:hypothetical protein